jgi:hypothetical protein
MQRGTKRCIIGGSRLRDATKTAGMLVCSTSTPAYYAGEGQKCSDGALFMIAADWHIVRSGHAQIIGDQRQITGDPFQFLPLFRTHREAESYCRKSGLWHQGIRPRQNSLAAVDNRSQTAGLSILFRQAIAEGVNAIGVFVGFNTHHQSCWEYYRVSSRTLGGMPEIQILPEDERPV